MNSFIRKWFRSLDVNQDLNLILKTEFDYLSSTTAPASSKDFFKLLPHL
jgi:hypothetical protein